MTLKSSHLLILFSLAAFLSSCKPENTEAERPLYPTEGAINARFSVSENVTVVFAKGNLQYQAETGTWRFASNQYETVGADNSQAAAGYAGWIDLFGWATSGYEGVEPYTTVDTNRYYTFGQQDIAGTEYDWGRHNKISNGGREAGLWRTLTYKEWKYVLGLREYASIKKAQATILNVDGHGTNAYGMVLLPDKWTLPESCTFQYGSNDGFATNVYTMGHWNLMEQAGAVFLPSAGYRTGQSVEMVNEYGCYWSANYYGDETAFELYFMDGRYDFDASARCTGQSVRLVQEK